MLPWWKVLLLQRAKGFIFPLSPITQHPLPEESEQSEFEQSESEAEAYSIRPRGETRPPHTVLCRAAEPAAMRTQLHNNQPSEGNLEKSESLEKGARNWAWC